MVEYLIEYFTGSQRATLYFPTLNSNYIYQQGEIRFHPNAVDIIYGSPTGKTLSSPISKSLSEVQKIQGNFIATANNEPFFYSEILPPRDEEISPISPVILSEEVQAILTKFDNGDYLIPNGVNAGIELVKSGSVTNDLFLTTFNNLIKTGIIIDQTIVTIPEVTLSSEVQAILSKFDNNDYTFPSWFSSNIDFVKDGSISSNEFLIAFNNLLQNGTIIDKTIVITYCVNVYTLDSGGNVLSDHYDKINLSNLQNLINENKYVFYCDDGIIPTEQQVRDFYGYTAPVEDSSINTMMISQSVGAFILKDGRLKGEILYIANQSFNSFYYGKNLTSLVQIKSKTGVPIAVKANNLNFTNTQRDERIQINEDVGNFKELIVDFFVWKSTTDLRQFSADKQIQVIEEPPEPECELGFHKDFSCKCVPDDPLPEIPRDKLIDTLKGFLFGTVALSLLARKY